MNEVEYVLAADAQLRPRCPLDIESFLETLLVSNDALELGFHNVFDAIVPNKHTIGKISSTIDEHRANYYSENSADPPFTFAISFVLRAPNKIQASL